MGILTAVFLEFPFAILCFLSVLAIVLSAVFVKQNIKFNFLISICAFLLGAVVLKNSLILPNCHIAKLIPYKSECSRVIGSIDNDPVYLEKNVTFTLKVEKIKLGSEWIKTCGKVLLKVYKKEKFASSEKLLVEGKLYQPFSFSREFNYRRYLRNQGIYLILSAKKNGVIERLGINKTNWINSLIFKAKRKIRDVFNKNLSSFSAGILNAFILGDRQDLPKVLMDMMVNLGIVHIVAISGFNIGIIAFITLVILKIMRIPRRPRYFIAMFLLIIYCALTGSNIPVVRATVMAIILLWGYFLNRDVNIYNSLALAALIMLTINPSQILEVSFQLSFLSVIFIVWLAPKIKKMFPERLNDVPWARFLIVTFSVSIAAWIGLLPLLAYYFKIISPITVLANMIIVPYATLIIISGFSLAFMGLIIPFSAQAIGASNDLLIIIMFKIISLLALIPGAYFKLPNP
ncbi:MAG: ComEC family competence protein [Candidatus Omnitrophica bacterium]|nr:ComEC family competence protein [Candidatus Omnitrophota bacterium]